jgi:hypothetical protein
VKFTLDTPILTFLANPKARAVLEQYMPYINSDYSISIMPLSLNQVLNSPLAVRYGLNKEKVEKILADVNQ